MKGFFKPIAQQQESEAPLQGEEEEFTQAVVEGIDKENNDMFINIKFGNKNMFPQSSKSKSKPPMPGKTVL